MVYGVAGREICGVFKPCSVVRVPFVDVLPFGFSRAIAVRTRSDWVWLFGAISCWGPLVSREGLILRDLKRSSGEVSSAGELAEVLFVGVGAGTAGFVWGTFSWTMAEVEVDRQRE